MSGAGGVDSLGSSDLAVPDNVPDWERVCTQLSSVAHYWTEAARATPDGTLADRFAYVQMRCGLVDTDSTMLDPYYRVQPGELDSSDGYAAAATSLAEFAEAHLADHAVAFVTLVPRLVVVLAGVVRSSDPPCFVYAVALGSPYD